MFPLLDILKTCVKNTMKPFKILGYFGLMGSGFKDNLKMAGSLFSHGRSLILLSQN